MSTPVTESILEEAQKIIFGARNVSYGHPRDNFKNIADLWTAYLGWEIKPMDVGLMMVLMKVARLENGVYHRDSIVDIAGYAGTIERLQEPVEPNGTIIFRNLDEPVDLDEPAEKFGELTAVKIGALMPFADWELELLGFPPEAPKPRVWDSLSDVPEGVIVRDKYGDDWKVTGGQSATLFAPDDEWSEFADLEPFEDEYAPFTEVLDG